MFNTCSLPKFTMSCLKRLPLCIKLTHKHQGVYGITNTLSRNHSSLISSSKPCTSAVPLASQAMPMSYQYHTQTQNSSHREHLLGRQVSSKHRVPSRTGVFSIGNISRNYSTEPEQDKKQVVQGKVVGLPNPINWIRNKISLYMIHRYMDSNFTYEEFTAGAKQATLIVMGHLSRKDFDGMTDLVAPEVIQSLKEFTADWVTKQWDAVSIGEEDVQFVAPKVASIKPEDDTYRLAIELLVVAFKSTSADAALVEVTTQFERSYTTNKTTEWIVSNIGPLKIRTYDVKDGQLR